MEADSPPIRRIAELDEPERLLAQAGLHAWQAGDLEAARRALRELLERAGDDARFHALHLLGCVAFSAGELDASRALHEEVLAMATAIGFLGGVGSSLYDLAMVDRASGHDDRARRRFHEAADAFRAGGYAEQLRAAEAALTRP